MPNKGKLRGITNDHRARLRALTEGANLRKVKKMYDAASEDLERRLATTLRAGRGATFGSQLMRSALAQVRRHQLEVGAKLADEMTDIRRDALERSLRGLVEDFGRYERAFRGADVELPVIEAARFQGIVDAREPSLLAIHETSVARYGADVIQGVQDELTLSLLGNETTDEAIGRVVDVIDGEWWQAERIVRTETAWAANSAAADGIEMLSEDVPDLLMRWTEYVDDFSGAPLDDRVGVDSLAMHGQVALPGEDFTMPPTSPQPDADGETRVSPSLVGKSWPFPPDRPNGREVLSPWRLEWGIPGWFWRGRRVPATAGVVAREIG